MGIVMAKKAEANLADQTEFFKQKKAKAQEVMKKQWDEQLKLKNNEELVNRIFA